jgi:hypothetical protein
MDKFYQLDMLSQCQNYHKSLMQLDSNLLASAIHTVMTLSRVCYTLMDIALKLQNKLHLRNSHFDKYLLRLLMKLAHLAVLA